MEKIVAYYYAARTKIMERVYKFSSIETDGNFVLMFHDIVDGPTDTKRFCSNAKDFYNYMDFVKKQYGFKSISDDLEKKGVVVTFDDGFSSIYDKVLPFFQKNNIPFTVFITTGFIDKPGYLTLSQLKALDKNELCTIGAHTMTHPKLRGCDQSKKEIEESGNTLREWLGHDIRFFAYPFGSLQTCSRKNRREARNGGYDCAFSTIRGSLSPRGNLDAFFLPRVNGDPLVLSHSKR